MSNTFHHIPAKYVFRHNKLGNEKRLKNARRRIASKARKTCATIAHYGISSTSFPSPTAGRKERRKAFKEYREKRAPQFYDSPDHS